MIEIKSFIEEFADALYETFGERVWFFGLQGSYKRGEATEKSDIDLVVILDELSAEDIKAYEGMLDRLSHRELICGFLSGRDELLNWEPSDLFQFYYDTKPIKGRLDELLLKLDRNAVKRAVKIGACNIYHGCVHNMLYEKSPEILAGLYKSASFVVRALSFLETDGYTENMDELLKISSPENREILENFAIIKNGGKLEGDFEKMSETLFNRAKEWI